MGLVVEEDSAVVEDLSEEIEEVTGLRCRMAVLHKPPGYGVPPNVYPPAPYGRGYPAPQPGYGMPPQGTFNLPISLTHVKV